MDHDFFNLVNLQTIGLVNASLPKSAGEAEMAWVLGKMVYVLNDIFGRREEGKLGNLRTIRILDDPAVSLRRKRKKMEMRLIERCLRGWTIVLEGGYGRLVVPLSL